ncbi:MAG: S8 family serine peptidase [Micromonosporaceae bacterium]|nr:S8 family serine peptidase [Micromonosporaceae bacterium]
MATAAALGGALAAPAPAAADWVRDDQWHLTQLDAPTTWHYATGAGVTVAVVDSGVDATHPDLVGQVLPGADFVDPAASDGRLDPVGHGTTVAAMIAGRADDLRGVTGLAPMAKILPVRVLDSDNKYDDAGVVAEGIVWAVTRGASIINLSLGGPARSDALAEALQFAADHEVVVIACTGNRGGGQQTVDRVWYPASEPGVVAVAGLAPSPQADTYTGPEHASTRGGRGASRGIRSDQNAEALWPGSVTGPQTVLTAPAAHLVGAKPGGYWRVQGTSFAAPLVAATAALVRSRWPSLDAANVINRLIRTAHDLGTAGRDARFGFGAIDPVSALIASVPEVSTNPLAEGVPVLSAVSASLPAASPAAAEGPPEEPAAAATTAATLSWTVIGGVLFTVVAASGLRRHRHPAARRRRAATRSTGSPPPSLS